MLLVQNKAPAQCTSLKYCTFLFMAFINHYFVLPVTAVLLLFICAYCTAVLLLFICAYCTAVLFLFSVARRQRKDARNRRQRTTFSQDQTLTLELEYQRNEYISRPRYRTPTELKHRYLYCILLYQSARYLYSILLCQ